MKQYDTPHKAIAALVGGGFALAASFGIEQATELNYETTMTYLGPIAAAVAVWFGPKNKSPTG